MATIQITDAASTTKYYAVIGDGDASTPFYGLVADYYGEMARGNVTDKSISTIRGRNSDVDIGTAEDVWEGGGDYTGQPVSFTPETVDVSSSSANDTSAGTGARTVRISGLKTSTSTAYETEDITMNGTSNVTSSSSWWRVNFVEVLTAGSGGENAGIITVHSTTTTANVFSGVPAGFNESQIAAYTVPFGQTGLIRRVRLTISRASGAAGSATLTLRRRPPGGVYEGTAFELVTGGPTAFTFLGGEEFIAGTDIKVRCDSVSDNNTIPEAAFEIELTAD